MMTQERIDYFLKLPKGEITNEEFEELKEDYFKNGKNDWYEEHEYISEYNEKKRKSIKWDERKIEEFWVLIRTHAIFIFERNKNFDFDFFCFPEFERDKIRGNRPSNFWTNSSFRKFIHKISFRHAMFLGDVKFSECLLNDTVDFRFTLFRGRIQFSETIFENHVNFSDAVFLESLEIRNTQFYKKVDFKNTFFNVSAYFENVSFIEKTHFSNLNGEGHYAALINFNSLRKKRAEKKYLTPKLEFFNVDFESKTKFSYFNVSYLQFNSTDIIKISFDQCLWNDAIKKGRLIFLGEDRLQNSENNYRQLKQNFTQIGNWELAGYAYVSEMEMRMKRYWQDGKYHFWIFYAFYKYLGGYTQDFIRPLIALFFSFVSFTFIYWTDHDFVDSLQMSISASIPYVQVQDHVEFVGYWLIVNNVQFILSVVLLSFFVLALRKRFKL